MAISWAASTTCAPNQLPLCGTIMGRYSTIDFSKLSSVRRELFCSYIARKRDARAFGIGVGRNRTLSSQTSRETWEDPDDGSDSEGDEEDEENDLDYESDWEEEKDVAASVSVEERSPVNEFEDDFVKKVERLLEPAEREILQRSETPNLEKISTEKWNPIHTYALSGQISSMDKVVEQGVHVDVGDKDGLTALHTAVLGNKMAVITHLLRKGASPHVRDKDGATPLHYAVQVGVIPIVKLLIKYNVDMNVEDNEGWTPLHVAAQTRSRDIMKILLLNGADSSRRNKDGNTALDMSLCYGKDFKSYDLATVLKVVPGNR